MGRTHVWSRRTLLSYFTSALALTPAARLGATSPALGAEDNPPRRFALSRAPVPQALSADDHELLEEVEQAAFLYFWEQTNPESGISRDRCRLSVADDKNELGSIASTGFGFSALCIGHARGFVPYDQAVDRAIRGLRFLWETIPNHRGFFYHWANITTGEREWDSEISSVDTAILLCGVLTCRRYFSEPEVERLAHQIFNRVDWNWLSEDTRILPHGGGRRPAFCSPAGIATAR